MSELLSLTTLKTPLVLRVKSQDLTKPRLLPKNLNRSLLNRVTLLLPLCLQGARGRGMKSKILAPLILRSLLPKKRHPRKRVPSTLTTMQAPLARKLLHCHYLFRCSFFYLHTHLSVLIVARKKRKKKPRFMVRLSRVPPKPWFSPKIAVLLRNPRLPLNKTWKPRHLQLAPKPPHRKEQGLRLAIVMRLSRGVPLLLLWTM